MRKGFHRVPELTGAPLVELIHARSGVPVFIDNDVNALALGEWAWGSGAAPGRWSCWPWAPESAGR